MSEADSLQISQEKGICVLTLNRPDRLNAFDEELSVVVQTALKDIERNDEVKVVVITGAGRGFCSGQDLQDGSESKSSKATHLGDAVRRKYNPVITKIRRIEKPFIAAVNGVAAGAGMGVALACDFRIMAQSASFVQAFSKIALVPDSGCTLLARLINPTKAFELMLTAEKLMASEALTLGLVNKVVTDAETMPTALNLAKQLAAGPGQAYALTKRAFNKVVFPDLEELLEYEAQLQDIAGQTQDYCEGVKAFIEKRPPIYSGK